MYLPAARDAAMFNFDGDHKKKRNINLGGNSKAQVSFAARSRRCRAQSARMLLKHNAAAGRAL